MLKKKRKQETVIPISFTSNSDNGVMTKVDVLFTDKLLKKDTTKKNPT